MVIWDYYRIFYYVAQYKSFTKAAAVLNNSQPNVTRCMNNLEHELQCRLFIRSNRGITLTEEGQQLYEHVAIACEQLLFAEEELRKNRELQRGLVTIGASETALRLLLLDHVETFHRKYPQIHLKILNYSTPQAVNALENALVDFSVVTTPVKLKKGLRQIPLAVYREILIGGPKYADYASKTHTLMQLQDIPFISLGNETGTRELYIQYFMEHNLLFCPDMEAATTDQILPMIRHNLGIGFYPEGMAAEPIRRGEIVSIPLAEPVPERQICLIQNISRPKSAAAKQMTDILLSASL